MNPFTLGWYLPVLMKEVGGGEEKKKKVVVEGGGGGGGDEWQEMDAKFRRDLPDEGYLGRLAYRGLIMRACCGMKRLDGIEITDKERTKALHVLAGIAKKKKRDGVMG
jgi:protein NUD1